MGRIRRFINENPQLGWILAVVLVIGGVIFAYARIGARDEVAILSEEVTVRCAETGEEWKMSRGMMEKTLLQRTAPLDPNEGLPNPKTGKNTGFPIDEQWKTTVEMVNSDRAAAAARRTARQQERRQQPPPPPGGG